MLRKPQTRSEDDRARCIEAYANAVMRYVVTHINRDGMRTLTHNAHGRWTYATAAEAHALLDGMLANNNHKSLAELYGDITKLEVRPCACWPVHFDPVGVWFDD